MADEKENLRAELRRELERVGLPRPEAEAIAKRQIGAAATRHPGRNPPQHVVPVSTGWIVIRETANLDLGIFEHRDAAIREARALAKASGASVIVHEE